MTLLPRSAAAISFALVLFACGPRPVFVDVPVTPAPAPAPTPAQARGPAPAPAPLAADGDDWRRGAVCYEVFIRSFYDSDGDGIGDINGLIERLDHINDGDPSTRRDLGARCIWLMPVAASPSYHGYDVTDYYRVNPHYGTNEDFKRLTAEARRRGIRVLVDLVVNHSSAEHPYFKEAQLRTDSRYRDWYFFSPTAPDVRGPWGQEVWHRSNVRDEFYFGIFVPWMPDLNWRNPEVVAEMKRVATFWLEEMGVDGFRLDAVTHLIEENGLMKHAPGTHDVLRDLASHVRREAPHAFTIGEVWDSTGAVLRYYPDQLDAYFAFELSDALISTVQSRSARGLFAPYLRLQSELPAERWSPFLRNHDQSRTMTVLQGDAARARLATTLLLTLPGLPFVYYGEEIGMTGDKLPRGEWDLRLRTPMHWRLARAAGFTTGAPWEPLQSDSLTANVEAQDADTASLLNLHRRLIHLRAANAALGAGELVPLTTNTDTVAAFLRRIGDDAVLVVVNLGTAPRSRITIASAGQVLPAGSYAARPLVGGPAGATLRIGAEGRVQGYVPVATLAPMTAYLFQLSRSGASAAPGGPDGLTRGALPAR